MHVNLIFNAWNYKTNFWQLLISSVCQKFQMSNGMEGVYSNQETWLQIRIKTLWGSVVKNPIKWLFSDDFDILP